MSHHLDEHELLAWIEGELPARREAEIRDALASDPELLAWAEQARADRAALRAWGESMDTSAPSGMVEDAIAMAERRALLDGDGSDLRLVGGGERPKSRIAGFPSGRLAAAAVLLLAAGAGVLMWPQIMGPASTPGPVVAERPGGAEEESRDQLEDAAADQAPSDRTTRERAFADRRSGASPPSDLNGARPVVGEPGNPSETLSETAMADRLASAAHEKNEDVEIATAPGDAMASTGEIREASVDAWFRLAVQDRLDVRIGAGPGVDVAASMASAIESSPSEVVWDGDASEGVWTVSFPIERKAIDGVLNALRGSGLRVSLAALDQPREAGADENASEEVRDLMSRGEILNPWARRGSATVRVEWPGDDS